MTDHTLPPQTAQSTAQILQQAIDFHRAGQLLEAGKLYQSILLSEPDHPEANHQLGMIAVQIQQPADGLPYFVAAINADPSRQAFWLSYIDALAQAGQLQEAQQVFALAQQQGLQGPETEALAMRLAEQSDAGQGRGAGEAPDSSAPPPLAGSFPSQQEMEALVTLFHEGRFAEAVTLAQTLTERFPMHAFGWKALGALLQTLGRNNEALGPMQKAAALAPDDVEAQYNLATILQEQGRFDEAEAGYRQALWINPAYADALSNLGVILRNAGRLDEAEACLRQAVLIRPDYAEALNNLGATLMDLDRLDEAEDACRLALQFNPDNAMAHGNLGNILHRLGQHSKAEAAYRRAIQINPSYADAHFNLGNTLHNQGQLDNAESSYRTAIQIQPDFTAALDNLALLLQARGKSKMALDTIKQSLKINETVEAKSIFVDCIKRLQFKHQDNEVRAFMVRALAEPWGRPNELARISADLIRLNPDIGACITRASSAWPRRLSAHDLFAPNGIAAVTADPLLHALLDSAPVCDMAIERFLTMARYAMLEAATETMASEDVPGAVLNFYSALARQCFINEYVFTYTDDEIRKAGTLRDSLVEALKTGARLPTLWPVAVSAYFPLSTLPLLTELLERSWPEPITTVLTQQVREPREEQQLRATIPRLCEIEDEVSLLVQIQYEENPYPRWIKMPPIAAAKDIIGYLRQKFPLSTFAYSNNRDRLDVLVAGCGTGQNSISAARRIHGSQVLAIDLSISSLSYAKRKTQELGLTSIEYAQADLLKLGSLGFSFDIIECSGVLHHIAAPWTGWRILLSLLRPGGFMKLGFYSEVARQDIVRIRTFIAEQGYGSTAEGIRQCRQDLMGLPNRSDFVTVLSSPDFFSTSACRDLLFHVQEHRMTLNSIDTFLHDTNLAFLGFDIEGDVLHAYQQSFPNDLPATNLEQWQIFENNHPDTFAGMYQFWVQKTA